MSEQAVQEVSNIIAQVHREVEKAFRELWARLSGGGLAPLAWEPPADAIEGKDEVIILVDVPGFTKDEIKVKVTESSVEISAQKGAPALPGGRYILRQRTWASLYKRIDLPVKVRPELAKARLENGVLEVRVPKSELAREVQVTVE